jgi:hypothetical protein
VSLGASISMYSKIWHFLLVFVLCTQVITKSQTSYSPRPEYITRTRTKMSYPRVRFPPWSQQTFQPARCGYTVRVTSQTSYSPEYITRTHTKNVIS